MSLLTILSTLMTTHQFKTLLSIKKMFVYKNFGILSLSHYLMLFPSEIKESVEAIQALYAVTERLPKSNYHLFERLIFHLAR